MKKFNDYYQIVLEMSKTKSNVVEFSIKIKETQLKYKEENAKKNILNKNLKDHAQELDTLGYDLRNQVTRHFEDDYVVKYELSDVNINNYYLNTEERNEFSSNFDTLDEVIKYLKDNLSHIVQLIPVITVENRKRANEAVKEIEKLLQPFKKDTTKWFIDYDFRTPVQDISVSHDVVTTTSQNELTITGILSDLYAVKKVLQEPDQEDDISNW
jgi:hypothetical protein